jgi:hypothetical protein
MPDLTKDERRALKQHMKGDKWSYSMGVSGRLCPSCAQGSPHAFPHQLHFPPFRPDSLSVAPHLQVMNVASTGFVIGHCPEHFWIVHLVKSMFMLTSRFFRFRRRGKQ